MIRLGNFTILLDENTGRFYVPEVQGICETLESTFQCIKDLIKTKNVFTKEELE